MHSERLGYQRLFEEILPLINENLHFSNENTYTCWALVDSLPFRTLSVSSKIMCAYSETTEFRTLIFAICKHQNKKANQLALFSLVKNVFI